MIEIHVNSLWIGVFLGYFIGVATSFFVSWFVDKKLYKDKDNTFSEGWHAGIKYHEAVTEKRRMMGNE